VVTKEGKTNEYGVAGRGVLFLGVIG